MTDTRKAVARIQVPPKKENIARPSETMGVQESAWESVEIRSESLQGAHLLRPKTTSVKRDLLVVPLVGLLLAFSVISLIVQLLIAFS